MRRTWSVLFGIRSMSVTNGMALRGGYPEALALLKSLNITKALISIGNSVFDGRITSQFSVVNNGRHDHYLLPALDPSKAEELRNKHREARTQVTQPDDASSAKASTSIS